MVQFTAGRAFQYVPGTLPPWDTAHSAPCMVKPRPPGEAGSIGYAGYLAEPPAEEISSRHKIVRQLHQDSTGYMRLG